jgi:hypothetical protein
VPLVLVDTVNSSCNSLNAVESVEGGVHCTSVRKHTEQRDASHPPFSDSASTCKQMLVKPRPRQHVIDSRH